MDLESFQGALIGTFVGDALGMPVEGMAHDAIVAAYGGPLRDMVDCQRRNMPAGCYTDDTEMMIGIAEALAEKGGLDCAVVGERFVANFHRERGYGPGTTRVLHDIAGGRHWEEPAREQFGGEGSLGNGAAMRIAPLGCVLFDKLDAIRCQAEDCSRITHTHPIGMEGGVVQAWAVALAVGADRREGIDPMVFLDALVAVTDKSEYIKALKKVRELLLRKHEPEVHQVVKALGNDIRAQTAVPAAIYSFLRNHTSFEEAVVYAVNLGGDTDTIGAMTGAIAGGLHGKGAVPERWLSALENRGKGRDHVLSLGERLWEMKLEGKF